MSRDRFIRREICLSFGLGMAASNSLPSSGERRLRYDIYQNANVWAVWARLKRFEAFKSYLTPNTTSALQLPPRFSLSLLSLFAQNEMCDHVDSFTYIFCFFFIQYLHDWFKQQRKKETSSREEFSARWVSLLTTLQKELYVRTSFCHSGRFWFEVFFSKFLLNSQFFSLNIVIFFKLLAYLKTVKP